MSEYFPPTENLPTFDSSVFSQPTSDGITLAEASSIFLKRTGVATSVASSTSFAGQVDISGEVNFNSVVSPPHCAILPSNEDDLCNKLYVDSQAALTAYQLYLNYSATFTTPAPASIAYKTLSQTQVPTPATVPFTISAIGSQQIAGFFNTLVAINIPTTIPAGVWTLLCFSNVNTIADQAHIGLQYTISSFDAAGAETLVYTSPVSALLSVVSPLIGTSSVSGTFPATTLAVGSTGIGLKLFITSNTVATRTGNIFFQNAQEYSSVLTSFAVTQAPDLLSLPNVWTNTNNFTAATTTTSISSSGNHIFSGANPTIQSTITSNPLIIRSDATSSANAIILRTAAGGDVNITPAGAVSVPSTLTVTGALNGIATISTKGTGGIAIGSVAYPSLSGINNTLLGNSCGSGITTGQSNTFMGQIIAAALTTGGFNTSIGQASLRDVTTTAANNTAIGARAGSNISTGNNNTNVGFMSSVTTNLNTTGTNNSTLGADTICGAASLNFATAIGAGAAVSASNTIVLGRSSDDTIVSGSILTIAGSAPKITSATLATVPLIIETPAAGTGYITLNPKGVNVLQVEVGNITANKRIDIGAGLTCVGTAAFGSSAISTTGVVTTGNISCGGAITMNNATLANRIINNVVYNFNNLTGGALSGNIYANVGTLVYSNTVLNGNHTFFTVDGSGTVTSLAISSTAITHNFNTTLPTAGIAPTVGQLGFATSPSYFAPSSLATATPRTLDTLSLLSGTYILNGLFQIQCSSSGTINSYSYGFSTSTTVFSSTGQLGLSTNIYIIPQAYTAVAGIHNKTTSCVITLTSATTIYLICSLTFPSGAYNIGGAASATRIA